MNLEPRDRVKTLGVKRFCKSFKYSMQGLKYAYTNEQSMLIHISITLLTIVGGFYFSLNGIEWILVTMFIGLVMGAELLNTAIEAVVDLVSPEYHELAKIAKDTASAAVFTLSTSAFVCALIIFLPKIIEMI